MPPTPPPAPRSFVCSKLEVMAPAQKWTDRTRGSRANIQGSNGAGGF